MHQKEGINWLAITLSLFIVLLVTSPIRTIDSTDQYSVDSITSWKSNSVISYTDHSPIAIDGDDNFNDTAQLEGWSGNGTVSNPFIIEYLRIHVGGTSTSRISISNTRFHFVIRNCNLADATTSNAAGVYLYNVTNGEISNNICFNNVYGVDIKYSQHCLIFNNTCVGNYAGISLTISSSSNDVFRNNCTSNTFGVFISTSTLNLIEDNTCTSNTNYGIYLNTAASNTVIDNTCSDNNFDIHLTESESNNITQNFCSGGSQRGIVVALSLYNRIENNTCMGNDEGIYIGPVATDNDVINNTVKSNIEYGIHLLTSSNNSLINNTCWNNTDWGIYLDQSDYNNLTSNRCSNSTYDIYLTSADYNRLNKNRVFFGGYGLHLTASSTFNSISDNEFYSNINYGLELTISDSNDITYNNFHNNMEGIFTITSSSNNIQWNIFVDNPYSIDENGIASNVEYNYYSDYTGTDADGNGIGDTLHNLWGNTDPYPLMYLPTPPSWNEMPENQFVTDLDIMFYHLNVTCPSPLSWSISNPHDFAVYDNGTIRSKDTLAIGEYGLIVNVTSIYNYSLVEEFTVFVQPWDMDPPSWVIEPEDQFVEFGSHLDYSLDVTDDSGISHWWVNTTDFAINDNGEIRSVVPLVIGIYGLEISVNDTYDNILSAIISVTVEDTTPPNWLTPPENKIVGFGYTFSYDLDADDLSGISQWWINSSVFTIDSNGLIENNTILPVGVYWIQVFVNDTIGNRLNATISVSVYDTILPTWNDLELVHTFAYNESVEISIDASDDQGINFYWLDNTENFTLDGSTIRNNTILPSGEYTIRVRAYDYENNFCEANLTIVIEDEPVPTSSITSQTTTTSVDTTTTSPPTNTTVTTEDGLDPMIIIAIGGGAIFFLLIVCIILRKKS
jgi:parallel beta-helix repeat protein